VQVARVREKSNIHPMNPTQSDTPRTDAMESCVKQYAVPQFELLLHAQKLERDLASVTAEVAELETEHKRVHAILDEAGVSTGPMDGVSARVSGACAFVRKCLAESEQANAGRRENGRRADRAEQRVAELVAALPEMIAMARAWRSTDGDPATDFVRRLEALDRAESATPAKHPDTERLDWLENRPCNSFASLGIDYSHEERVYRTDAINSEGVHPSLRAAIDAAKETP